MVTRPRLTMPCNWLVITGCTTSLKPSSLIGSWLHDPAKPCPVIGSWLLVAQHYQSTYSDLPVVASRHDVVREGQTASEVDVVPFLRGSAIHSQCVVRLELAEHELIVPIPAVNTWGEWEGKWWGRVGVTGGDIVGVSGGRYMHFLIDEFWTKTLIS